MKTPNELFCDGCIFLDFNIHYTLFGKDFIKCPIYKFLQIERGCLPKWFKEMYPDVKDNLSLVTIFRPEECIKNNDKRKEK